MLYIYNNLVFELYNVNIYIYIYIYIYKYIIYLTNISIKFKVVCIN